jgi:hypothetical protein
MTYVKTMALALALVGSLACLSGARLAIAEEGGSGHYQPGSMASFIDGVPQQPTFIARYNLISYSGSVDPSVALPIGGQTALDADASLWAQGLSLLWRPPVELGARWSYALSATIPLISLDVTADVRTQGPGGGTVTASRSDDVFELGDIILMPLMLNYHVNPDVNLNFRVALYAPTGGYEVGRLANAGKNFWTIEPTLAFMYFGTKNGRELSVFMGFDFNTENPDTNYQSGTQFHLDGTLAQHFPLFGGLAGVGASGIYYQQISGDSGEGATFGAFKARDIGIGPVVSYSTKVGGVDLVGELKWLHEFGVKRRLEGDIVFFKWVVKL